VSTRQILIAEIEAETMANKFFLIYLWSLSLFDQGCRFLKSSGYGYEENIELGAA
jgi:hypothetical protein